MSLKSSLKEFEALTNECINMIELDKFTKLESLLAKRQSIIDNIKNLNYSSEEFKTYSSEYNIIELENKLRRSIAYKRMEVKKKINDVKVSKKAHNVYNSSFMNNSFFLKKRI